MTRIKVRVSVITTTVRVTVSVSFLVGKSGGLVAVAPRTKKSAICDSDLNRNYTILVRTFVLFFLNLPCCR